MPWSALPQEDRSGPGEGQTQADPCRCRWRREAPMLVEELRMRREFTIIVERDPESRWLVGEVVELPGCYTQASDLPSLEANVGEAIRAYLAAVEEIGRAHV